MADSQEALRRGHQAALCREYLQPWLDGYRLCLRVSLEKEDLSVEEVMSLRKELQILTKMETKIRNDLYDAEMAKRQ